MAALAEAMAPDSLQTGRLFPRSVRSSTLSGHFTGDRDHRRPGQARAIFRAGVFFPANILAASSTASESCPRAAAYHRKRPHPFAIRHCADGWGKGISRAASLSNARLRCDFRALNGGKSGSKFLFCSIARMAQVLMMFSSACILAVTECYRGALVQLRKNERERELVMKELEHRGRNTYAVIDAIVQKTLENAPEKASIISGRIRAVKFANDLLNQTATHTVLLKTLLLDEFAPYGEARFYTEGPEIELSPDTARNLALAFHELVTNAAKHGALSHPDGRVLISWKSDDGVVRLEWREEGGPLVSPPTEHGFGSRLVAQSLKSVSGSITPTFTPHGLHCAITFQVS
jgi:two-component sensor histidine kinase